MHTIDRIPLPVVAPGTERYLTVHRFGTGRPKAYIHTALHADEWPGLLVLQHLLARLREADAAGQIIGEVVVVPAANPVGLAQSLNYHLVGRYDFAGSGNFNRNYPALAEQVLKLIGEQIAQDPAQAVGLIRQTLREILQGMEAGSEAQAMKLALLSLSIDADIVLDLHCDSDALMHLYAPLGQRQIAEELGAELGARAVLLEEEPGGGAFDQANSSPWRTLREQYPELPLACFASTVELRGAADISDDFAKQDSAALFRFLQRRGVIGGEPGDLPPAQCEPTLLQGTDVLRAPAAGILSYRKQLGDQVQAGDIVADLIVLDDLSQVNRRLAIPSRASGVLFARVVDKLVRPGGSVGKVAGADPLPHRKHGALLEE